MCLFVTQISFADMMTAIFTMLLGALGIGQALMDMGDQRVGFLAAQRIFRTIDEGTDSFLCGMLCILIVTVLAKSKI